MRGVHIIKNGKSSKIYAREEVILSCGIHSNEILQRSGVGPAKLLRDLGIDVKVDNSAVGAGSKNHLINTATFSINPNDYPGTKEPNALYVGGAFLPAPNNEVPNKRGFQRIGLNPSKDAFVVIFYNLNSQSVGEDRIQNKNPFKVSAVTENLLSNPKDLDAIIAVYQQQITALARELALIDPNYKL